MCGSARFRMGTEKLALTRKDGTIREIEVRRWACDACGERFLTEASRGKIDEAYGLGPRTRQTA